MLGLHFSPDSTLMGSQTQLSSPTWLISYNRKGDAASPQAAKAVGFLGELPLLWRNFFQWKSAIPEQLTFSF